MPRTRSQTYGAQRSPAIISTRSVHWTENSSSPATPRASAMLPRGGSHLQHACQLLHGGPALDLLFGPKQLAGEWEDDAVAAPARDGGGRRTERHLTMDVVARNGTRVIGSSELRGTKYSDALHSLRCPASLRRAPGGTAAVSASCAEQPGSVPARPGAPQRSGPECAAEAEPGGTPRGAPEQVAGIVAEVVLAFLQQQQREAVVAIPDAHVTLRHVRDHPGDTGAGARQCMFGGPRASAQWPGPCRR